MPRRPLISACLALAGLCLAGPAAASPTQETILQDDPQIVYHSSAEQLDRTLARVKSLGVDTIRISVFWNLVAPRPESRRKPDWGRRGGRDPANYPAGRWDRYDLIVKLARRHRLKVLMTLTGSAPAWGHKRRKGKGAYYRPNASEFGDFATAAGRRYSGSYPDPNAPKPPPPEEEGPEAPIEPPVGTTEEEPPPPSVPPLPRVGAWSIWNEPNFPSWLSPQRTRFGRRGIVPSSPALYRRLLDTAYAGLSRTGHARDTILIGETAPRGGGMRSPVVNKTMIPMVFLRELYCVTPAYRPYRGRAARRRGCPPSRAARRRFVSRHPGLFRISGWAHHPYSLDRRPTWKYPHKDAVTLGSLRHLGRVLDRSLRRWGVRRRLPIYLTEYGYQTRPPSPFGGVSPRRQASWTTWAEEVAFRNRRVAAFAQFLLVDDRPHVRYKGKLRWVTWQSGLLDWDLRPKPAYREFRRPIRVSPYRTRRRGRVRVFGAYRPPEAGSVITARIQYRPIGGRWRTVRAREVRNKRGYLYERVRVPRSGSFRIVWLDPDTLQQVHSRTVPVKARG